MTTSDALIARAEALLGRLERLVPPRPGEVDWTSARALRWRRGRLGGGWLEPVRRTSRLRLDDLRCIDHQKAQLVLNTRQFVAGLPANNALLWGPRGTGKSSLVKAILNEYADDGLRVVEVDKHDLIDLPDIVAPLAGRPEHFVVFCDDLSFDAGDSRFKALKVVLDGSVTATPDNVLVYATSNRRHLLPERLGDNLDAHNVDGEIHHGEAVEEQISLSERFGLWIAFHPFSQERYLEIVDHWLARLGVAGTQHEPVREEALRWALLHGSRSGRSAWQFAKDRAGRVGLGETGP